MAETFSFRRRARQPQGLAITGIALVALAVLAFGVHAHPVVLAVFAAITAPAVLDVLRNAEAGIEIGDTDMTWHVGARRGQVALAEIEDVRLRTRLDFSQYGAIYLKDGRKLTLPAPCLPAGRELDAALETRGVAVTRTLF